MLFAQPCANIQAWPLKNTKKRDHILSKRCEFNSILVESAFRIVIIFSFFLFFNLPITESRCPVPQAIKILSTIFPFSNASPDNNHR